MRFKHIATHKQRKDVELAAEKIPYRLEQGTAPGVRLETIAHSLTDRILSDLEADDAGTLTPAYDARKKLKRLRALMRLVRPLENKQARAINTHCRAAGKALGPFRDRDAAAGALEDLIAHFAPALDPDDFSGLRRKVLARRDRAALGITGLREALNFARADLFLVKDGLREIEWAELAPDHICTMVQKDYKRTRNLYAGVLKHRSIADAHEWRRSLKYHWLEVRMMRPVWPGDVALYQAHLRQAIDALGALQDLEVLVGALEKQYESVGQKRLIHALAEMRSAELINAALDHASPALADKPGKIGLGLREGLKGFVAALAEQSREAVA